MLSPLILECARPQPDRARLRQFAAAVDDWDAVVSQAEEHGLAPLLHWHLQAEGADVPEAPAHRLRDRFRRNACRNLRFGSELLQLSAILESAGIPVLAFKGPVTAWTLYESPALREMSDVDILVPPADARRAYDLLLSEGCVSNYPGADWRMFDWLSETSLNFGEVPIDLHWASLPRLLRFADAGAGAWMRSRQVPVAGGAVRTLSPEDLLLFLSIHGAKHCWTSLNWLADWSRLAARPEVDWDVVIARARAGRASRTLSLALALIRDLLECPSPVDLPGDPIATALAQQLSRELRSGSGWPHTTGQRIRFAAALAETPAAKALVFWNPLQPTLADDAWLRFPGRCITRITWPGRSASWPSTPPGYFSPACVAFTSVLSVIVMEYTLEGSLALLTLSTMTRLVPPPAARTTLSKVPDAAGGRHAVFIRRDLG